MAFVSFAFLLFLLIVTVVYFLVPPGWQWTVLLISSYIFFWVNSGFLALILLGTSLVTFAAGLSMQRIQDSEKRQMAEITQELSGKEKKEWKNRIKKRKKRILVIGILLDLSPLLFLKYYELFSKTLNPVFRMTGYELPEWSFLLPLGISFYTLQAIGYLADVYRGKIQADRHPVRFLLFLSFFPQIVQGPIARYRQLAHQLYEAHRFDSRRVTMGAWLILWGWMKKTMIADRLAVPVEEIFSRASHYHGMLVFFAAAGYGLQVYADFSGGMDIARGVSQMLGIELELNFKQPYFATSIEDFWRRWHITLGQWMRDYVFYPLSMSASFGRLGKKSRRVFGAFVGKRLPSFLSMFLVFFLVGLWHGPNFKYVAYGIWNGFFIVSGILLAEVYASLKLRLSIAPESFSWRLFLIFRTFVLVSVGRFFSRAGGFMHAIRMMRSMLVQFWDFTFLLDGSLKDLGLDTANWIVLLLAVMVLFTVDLLHEKSFRIRAAIAKEGFVFRWLLVYAAILCIMILGVYGPEYHSAAFIYEQV